MSRHGSHLAVDMGSVRGEVRVGGLRDQRPVFAAAPTSSADIDPDRQCRQATPDYGKRDGVCLAEVRLPRGAGAPFASDPLSTSRPITAETAIVDALACGTPSRTR